MLNTNYKVFPMFFIFDLQLFADGGASAGGDGGTGASGDGTGVSAGAPGLQNSRSANNPLANVQYGIQDGDSQASNVSSDDRAARFEAMIKGEFKDLYDAKMQDTIQRRLKGSKETVDKYNALTPTLEMLYDKYGVDVGDVEGLNEAIREDDSYYEEEALEKGVTIKQLKEIKAMERENAELRQQMQDRKIQQQAEQDIAKWMEEAKEAAKVFPGLDLRTELQNPQFIGLLKSNVDLQTAYFAIHHQELVPQAMQFAARQTEQQVTNRVMYNGQRPSENGTRSQSPVTVKRDVSRLTKADREEINRRVAAGEKIRF